VPVAARTRRPRPMPPRPIPPRPIPVEERALPIVRELARIAKTLDSAPVKLEGALEVLFGAFGEADPTFSGLVLDGWMRARTDKRDRKSVV